jgi:hypothetical protein
MTETAVANPADVELARAAAALRELNFRVPEGLDHAAEYRWWRDRIDRVHLTDQNAGLSTQLAAAVDRWHAAWLRTRPGYPRSRRYAQLAEQLDGLAKRLSHATDPDVEAEIAELDRLTAALANLRAQLER